MIEDDANHTDDTAVKPVYKKPTIVLPGAPKKERIGNAVSAQAQQTALADLCKVAPDVIKTLKDLLIDPAAKIRLGAATVLLGKLLPDKLNISGDALDQLETEDLLSIVRGETTLDKVLEGKPKNARSN